MTLLTSNSRPFPASLNSPPLYPQVVASGLLLRKAVVMSAAKRNFQTLEELTECMRWVDCTALHDCSAPLLHFFILYSTDSYVNLLAAILFPPCHLPYLVFFISSVSECKTSYLLPTITSSHLSSSVLSCTAGRPCYYPELPGKS